MIDCRPKRVKPVPNNPSLKPGVLVGSVQISTLVLFRLRKTNCEVSCCVLSASLSLGESGWLLRSSAL
jgi:hypothetical protein